MEAHNSEKNRETKCSFRGKGRETKELIQEKGQNIKELIQEEDQRIKGQDESGGEAYPGAFREGRDQVTARL